MALTYFSRDTTVPKQSLSFTKKEKEVSSKRLCFQGRKGIGVGAGWVGAVLTAPIFANVNRIHINGGRS